MSREFSAEVFGSKLSKCQESLRQNMKTKLECCATSAGLYSVNCTFFFPHKNLVFVIKRKESTVAAQFSRDTRLKGNV